MKCSQTKLPQPRSQAGSCEVALLPRARGRRPEPEPGRHSQARDAGGGVWGRGAGPALRTVGPPRSWGHFKGVGLCSAGPQARARARAPLVSRAGCKTEPSRNPQVDSQPLGIQGNDWETGSLLEVGPSHGTDGPQGSRMSGKRPRAIPKEAKGPGGSWSERQCHTRPRVQGGNSSVTPAPGVHVTGKKKLMRSKVTAA